MEGLAAAAPPGLAERFCQLPFTFAEIHRDGDVFLCCPQWSGFRPIGNIFHDGPQALWNSLEAQQIRAGILDGTFSHCDCGACPDIMTGRLPLRRDALAKFGSIISQGLTQLDRLPDSVKLCHDDTCNLFCPSCRDTMIVANRERQEKLDEMLNGFIVPFLADARYLCLSGDGDPFASRHYRDIMRATATSNPGLRIALHTNAVLCDEKAWDDCRLASRASAVLVSIDAASAETYAIVRRGGDYQRLLRNLEFIARMRQARVIDKFEVAFVVQAVNFREMPAFVRLGERLGVDRVGFLLVRHWSRAMSEESFAAAQVWRPDHPLYSEFRAVLDQPELQSPIVDLGDATPPPTQDHDRHNGTVLKLYQVVKALGVRAANSFDAD